MKRHLLLTPLLLIAGCQVFGVIAGKAPPPTVEAAYVGLVGKDVGVMVWADNSVTRDFPNIQQDLAGGVQAALQTAIQSDSKMKELQGTTFVDARKLRRYQKDHPELDASPVEDFAPSVGVSRLIYIQIDDFQTRAANAFELYRGSLTATVRVYEVVDGKAKQAFSDSGVHVVFPEHVTEDGTPNGNDDAMYVGTLRAASFDVAKRFIPHPDEDYGN